MKKRFWWILAGVIVFFLITNPSIKDFKDFSGEDKLKRESNFLVFSFYSSTKKVDETEEGLPIFYRKEYLGIIKNFFSLPLISSNVSADEKTAMMKARLDSIAAADSLNKVLNDNAAFAKAMQDSIEASKMFNN